MSVTINGTVCRNCFDLDWAKQSAAVANKRHELEAAKKAKEAVQPPHQPGDPPSQADQTSGFDADPAVVLGGSLADSGSSDDGPPPPVTQADLAAVKVDMTV